MRNHLGYVTAELTRAYPVGSTTDMQTTDLPEITSCKADVVQREVDALFSTQRCTPPKAPAEATGLTTHAEKDAP